MYLFNVSRQPTKTSPKFSHLPFFSLHNPILQICVTASFLPFSIAFSAFSCSFLSFCIHLLSLPPCLYFLPCMTENTNFHTTSTLPLLAVASSFPMFLFSISISLTLFSFHTESGLKYTRDMKASQSIQI